MTGYLHISDEYEKCAVWHCWVGTPLGKLDVATAIFENLFPKIGGSTVKECFEILDDAFERCDMETKHDYKIRWQTQKLYEKYIRSDKASFWECQNAPEVDQGSFKNTVMFRNGIMLDLKHLFW